MLVDIDQSKLKTGSFTVINQADLRASASGHHIDDPRLEALDLSDNIGQANLAAVNIIGQVHASGLPAFGNFSFVEQSYLSAVKMPFVHTGEYGSLAAVTSGGSIAEAKTELSAVKTGKVRSEKRQIQSAYRGCSGKGETKSEPVNRNSFRIAGHAKPEPDLNRRTLCNFRGFNRSCTFNFNFLLRGRWRC